MQELGQREDFVMKKCNIPIHQPQQNYILANDFFRKREEYIVVVPSQAYLPPSLDQMFDDGGAASETLVRRITVAAPWSLSVC